MVMFIYLQSQNLELDVGCHMSKLQDGRVSTVAAGFVCKYLPTYVNTYHHVPPYLKIHCKQMQLSKAPI